MNQNCGASIILYFTNLGKDHQLVLKREVEYHYQDKMRNLMCHWEI